MNLLLVLIMMLNVSAHAQQRFALVVGNQTATASRAADVSANDVDTISAALERAGFSVTGLRDQSGPEFRSGLSDWSRAVTPGATVVFYFSGGVVSAGGINYLLPPTAGDGKAVELSDAIPLNQTIKRLRSLASTFIVVIEAAKPDAGGRYAAPANLRERYKNTVVMFAATPGTYPVAWRGSVSLFTGVLANQLRRPGQSLSGLFSQVTNGVTNGSGGKQLPWIQSSLTDRFMFNEGSAAVSATLTTGDSLRTVLQLDVEPIDAHVCFYYQQWQCGVDSQLIVGKPYQVFASMPGYQDYSTTIDVSAEHQKLQIVMRRSRQVGAIQTQFGTFRAIQGGFFVSGSPAKERGRQPNEKQKQQLVSSFYMLENEVTFADYRKFAKATGVQLPSDNKWGRKKRPVINIGRKQAQAYVEWLSAETGHDVRLPTTVQWEHAARAGTTSAYHFGARLNAKQANFQGRKGTVPVKSFKPNQWGLYDMHGNVWEYACKGKYIRDVGCEKWALKGGGWNSIAAAVRSAYETIPSIAIPAGTIGLRPIVIIDE